MTESIHIQIVRYPYVGRTDIGIVVVEPLHAKLLDEIVINQVEDDITREVICRETPPLLVVSFTQVHFFSSMALRMLLNLRQKVLQEKGQMRLAKIRPEIIDIFTITRLDRLFQIDAQTEDAVAKMQSWLRLTSGGMIHQ